MTGGHLVQDKLDKKSYKATQRTTYFQANIWINPLRNR